MKRRLRNLGFVLGATGVVIVLSVMQPTVPKPETGGLAPGAGELHAAPLAEEDFLAEAYKLCDQLTAMNYAIEFGGMPAPTEIAVQEATTELRDVLTQLQNEVAPLACTSDRVCPEGYQCDSVGKSCKRTSAAASDSANPLNSLAVELNQYARAIKYSSKNKQDKDLKREKLEASRESVKKARLKVGGCDTDAQCHPKICCPEGCRAVCQQ